MEHGFGYHKKGSKVQNGNLKIKPSLKLVLIWHTNVEKALKIGKLKSKKIMKNAYFVKKINAMQLSILASITLAVMIVPKSNN